MQSTKVSTKQDGEGMDSRSEKMEVIWHMDIFSDDIFFI